MRYLRHISEGSGATEPAYWCGVGAPPGGGPTPVPRLTYDPAMTPRDIYDAGPTDRKPPFRFSAHARVWFSDTDAQGVVYYGRYLPYFDHARLEYHRYLGLRALWQGKREFVMRAMSVEYEAPAVFDDLLEVFVRTIADRAHERDRRVRRLPGSRTTS